MTFEQLEYFLTIAQTGSFSAAAENVHISQSSLSKQIQALERELDARLFIRDAGGARLTAAGETFLKFAQKTLLTFKETRSEISQYDSVKKQRVKFGGLPLMSACGFSFMLADFQLENINIQIDLVEREQINL
ncbi:MAG: LysR family transcriptional regulator, partial [Coriobacteriales bacterium]|nr:LysR family transcriptional regulator [Coriobacteriales bacterium]